MENCGPRNAWPDQPWKRLIAGAEWELIATFADLTPRELEVCRHVFAGRTRDEVAKLIGVATRTIRFHMEALHNKLRVKNRVELVLRLIHLRDLLRSTPQSETLKW